MRTMNKEVRRHRSRWHLPRIVRSVRRILSRVALCRDSFERSTIRGRFGASRDGLRLAMYFELSYYPPNKSPETTALALAVSGAAGFSDVDSSGAGFRPQVHTGFPSRAGHPA
jgi:hypothetical protein